MLAKRFYVAVFAALVIIGLPMAFSGNKDLFVDTPAGLLTDLAGEQTVS